MAKSDIVYAVNSVAERSERQLRKQLYFNLWLKLYYICHNFPERENKSLRSKISLRKQYNLPLGKYSCGVAIIPIATPLKEQVFLFN